MYMLKLNEMIEKRPRIVSNQILEEDLVSVFDRLSDSEKDKLFDSTILITGCGGFLGYYFMHFFIQFASKLKIKKIVALENFQTGSKDWLDRLTEVNQELVELYNFNIVTDSLNHIQSAEDVDFVIHLASIASPSYYRKFPIETVDANV